MKKQRIKKLFLEQLRRTPVVQAVCDKFNISRAIVYVWRKDDEEFRKVMDDALGEGDALVNDMAVSVVLQRINNGEIWPATFWLTHRHPQFKNKLEVDATIRPVRDELTAEQEASVKKALTLAGLLKEPSDTDPSNGAEKEKENSSENINGPQPKSEPIEQ